MHTEIIQFLTDLWYNHKQAQIYLTLYQIWSSPASSIATRAWYERVTTYKTLQQMVDDGIIAQTRKSSTAHFWIPDESLLLSYISKHRDQRVSLAQQYPYIQTQLQSLRSWSIAQAPKIQLYEGTSQMTNLFGDIQHTISQQNLLSISVFGTHTFQEQIVSNNIVSDYAHDLLSYLDHHHVAVHNHIAEWWLIMEHIRSYPGIERLWDLPAWDNAINIFVVGQIIYLVIYRWSPVWLKISSPELARAMSFILKQTNLKS